jgi:hypothetical protein
VDSTNKIVARVARTLSSGDVLDGLTRTLPPTDLQSLMLHVYGERSARRTPAELLAQYQRSPMLRPAPGNPRALVELERLAFECAASFEAVDLSPVAPLGLNVVLGQIDQNSCLATVRGAEVLADPTTVAALECARRRKEGTLDVIRLCARGRMLRLQPFDTPGFSPHFGLFAMVSAGRDRGQLSFEVATLREHLEVYLSLLERRGIGGVTVQLSDTARDESRLERAQKDVIVPLAARFPRAALSLDRTREQGRSYYHGLCIKIDALDDEGRVANLADGGFTTWTQRLLSNAKERMFVSGMGLELLLRRWAVPPDCRRPERTPTDRTA